MHKTNSLYAGTSILVLAMAALAQGAAAQDNTKTQTSSKADDTVVVVTGSRVVKSGDNSPSPVTVLPTADILKVEPGATLADALNSLPVFAGSRSAASNPTSVGSAAGGNGDANQLNLRNLGTTRTLVLMDGMRVPPTLQNAVVDVDIIPQMLVSRVDIVTGGVSAVYGSDAMSGVVNYIINRKFNGFRADASYGITQYGDDVTTDGGVAWGHKLGDKAHLELSYEYHKEDGIPYRTDRSWFDQAGVAGSVAGSTAAPGSINNPFEVFENLRQSAYTFGGLITSGALKGQTFDQNGVLSAFTAGKATGTSGVQVGGDGAYANPNLLGALHSGQFFSRFDYDFSDDIHGYAEIASDIKTNINEADTNQLTNVTLSTQNAFLSPAYRTAMAGASTFTLSEYMNDVPRQQATAHTNQLIFTTGLDGKFAGAKWKIDYSHGDSKLRTDVANIVNNQHLALALDAVQDPSNPTGAPICYSSINNPTNGCVAFNPFGPTAASRAAIKYITDTLHIGAETKMDDVSAQLTGSPFSTWAGPVNTALSAEWRKTSYTSFSSILPTAVVDCTTPGMRYNCVTATATKAGTALASVTNGQNLTPVSQTVSEIAGEFDMPLLNNSPLAKSLSLNGAVRYTDYDTSGDYWTWKLGVDWQMNDTLRFRATRSSDIRAPTLYDLYSPNSVVPVSHVDYNITGNPSATVPSLTESNPNLKAELGNTWTAGFVWKPIPKLSFAIDGYDIKVTNAITQIDGSTQAYQQLCYASGGSSPYCALQVRPGPLSDHSASNAVTEWIVEEINVAEVETWGVDFETNYATDLFGRPMTLRLLTDYQPHVYYRQPGTTTIDQGGVAFGPLGLGAGPALRLNGFFHYQATPHFSIDLMERWRNHMKLGGDPTQYWTYNRINAFGTTGVTLTWDDGRRLQYYANVQNLFNAAPPPGGYSGNSTRAGLRDGFALGDDVRGRFYTVGLKLKM